MNSKLTLTKRKRLLLATVVICTVLIAGLAILWQGGKVSEAAVLTPHPGLVGWWQFNEGTGTVAGDNSTNGNSGTITGAAWVDGQYGKALSFSGSSSSYANVASMPTLSQLSVVFWAKISGIISPPYDWQPIIHGANPTASPLSSYEIFFNPAINYLLVSLQGTSTPTLQVPYTLQVGVWYFVALTYNGSTANVYINNILVQSWSTSGSITNQNGLTIATDGTYSFDGIVDEVSIYSRALSAAEIQTGFQQSPGFSSNLLAKVPKGTTDFIVTVSWQGTGSINVTIQSPSQNYNEDIVPVYQKTTYSASGGTSTMLNIKRLEVSIGVGAITSDQDWYIILVPSNVQDYKITVEVQT